MLGVSIFYVCIFIIFIILNNHKKKFDKTSFDEMVYTVSNMRDMTNDLCSYILYGDPNNTGNNHVKIEFICLNSKVTLNNISLAPVKSNSLKDILIEFSRIVNYDFSLWDKQEWSCLVNNNPVDLNADIPVSSYIVCKQGRE